MTKKELREIINTAPWPHGPFRINNVWVCLSRESERPSGKSFYAVSYNSGDVMFCSDKTELIDYLYKKVNT